MSWATPYLQVGNTVIDLPQSIQATASYQEIGAVSDFRTISGRTIRQILWQKLRLELSGEGYLPVGIGGVDWYGAQEIKCSIPLSVQILAKPTNNKIWFRVPAANIQGIGPKVFALVNGAWLPTTAMFSTESYTGVQPPKLMSVATIPHTPSLQHPTAIAYRLDYFPQFTGFLSPPTIATDRTSGVTRWSVTIDEA